MHLFTLNFRFCFEILDDGNEDGKDQDEGEMKIGLEGGGGWVGENITSLGTLVFSLKS